MMDLYQICVIISIICLVSLIKHILKRKKHPPGPLGFPHVGLLPFRVFYMLFSRFLPKLSPVKYFRQMKEKYGDMWSIEVGSQRIVILASLNLIQEAFVDNGNLFAGRPNHEAYKIISESRGILFIDGEMWKLNRQLAIKALRDLGMGKRDLENAICSEADKLIEYLKDLSASSINSSTAFIKAVSNVVSKLTFDERNNYSDPDFERYVQSLQHLAHSDVGDKKIGVFPRFFQTKFARFLFPDVDRFLNCNKISLNFIVKKCRSRLMKDGNNATPSCVFDYFWRNRTSDDLSMSDDLRIHDISHSMFDLFSAGIDTTNNVLIFCCLMLGRFPKIQQDLRTEIQHLGDDHRSFTMAMKKDCPKLISFIDEVQRYCHLVPKVHHRVMDSCVFNGYKLHPSDIILGDLATISRDSRLFKNPDVFDPYRFMDEKRTKYIPNKALVPFGIGKRACLGESIAVMELFLFFTRLICRFDISLPVETLDNIEDILVGQSAIVHAALDHDINITWRQLDT